MLKKLLEVVESEKESPKKKVVEKEGKYNSITQSSKVWANKYNFFKEMSKIMHNLCGTIKNKDALLIKQKTPIYESCGRLEILHNICLAHVNTCPVFDLLYFAYKAEYPHDVE